MLNIRFLPFIFGALLITGCAHTPKEKPQTLQAAIPTPEIHYKSFEKDTLLDLMMGELASKQGHLDILLDKYVKQARKTQDPAVIERALQVALYLKKPDIGAEMAQLWVKTEPKNPQALNYAFFYLGQLSIIAKDTATALSQFQKVTSGPFFSTAQIQAAQILADQNQLTKARQLLTKAREKSPEDAVDLFITEAALLIKVEDYKNAEKIFSQAFKQFPEDPQLLYSHSVLAEQLEDWDSMEHDLRALIKIQPDNATALNALGYTLADQNRNLKEAETLIQKAHQLQPNDASIMDSVGWIHYRLGHYTDAQKWLEKAYQQLPDHEIAAHLGEVLWVQGQKEQAMKIWRAALQKTQDSDVLKNTMKRFHVE